MPKVFASREKEEARNASILRPALEVFGEKLPAKAVYVATAGSVLDRHGQLNPNCEALWGNRNGLYTESQFRGLDTCREIIDTNTQILPAYWWRNEPIETFIEDRIFERGFFPAVVHLDTQQMMTATFSTFCRVFTALSKIPTPTLLVFNVITKNPHGPQSNLVDDIKERIENTFCFQSFQKLWRFHNIYPYPGSDGRNMQMCSFSLTKVSSNPKDRIKSKKNQHK